MSDPDEMAKLHSAGATVRHVSPFDNLPSHKNEQTLSAGFIKKWAVPYYMEIGGCPDALWIDPIKEIRHEITMEVCLALLGDFNWRTRSVGAYFAAIKGFTPLIDVIGIHLLKSEVCCVGHIYALTLAHFNTEKSIQYLNTYLEYYLMHPELYFDQKSVMEAVLFWDRQHVTDHAIKHMDKWRTFEQERLELEKGSVALISESERSLRELTTTYFDEQIVVLRDLSEGK